jgi:uncharacterized protein YdaU (DUF1376 family)
LGLLPDRKEFLPLLPQFLLGSVLKGEKFMATKVDIWMPLYIADYLSATSRLTTEQHGAYLLLIMDYWKNGAPPDNNQILAQITKLSPDAWSNARTMLQPFFEVMDGLWVQHRIEAEMVKAQHNKQVNVKRGKAGAEARWKDKNAPSIDEAYSEVCSADSTSPSPSPSPISSIKKQDTKVSLSAEGLPTCPHQDILLLYKKHLPHLTQPRVWEGNRQVVMKQRWIQAAKPSNYSPEGYKTKEDGLKWWDSFFSYIANDSSLSNGFRNKDRTWLPDLEWIINSTNFAKIIDGKYAK